MNTPPRRAIKSRLPRPRKSDKGLVKSRLPLGKSVATLSTTKAAVTPTPSAKPKVSLVTDFSFFPLHREKQTFALGLADAIVTAAEERNA